VRDRERGRLSLIVSPRRELRGDDACRYAARAVAGWSSIVYVADWSRSPPEADRASRLMRLATSRRGSLDPRLRPAATAAAISSAHCRGFGPWALSQQLMREALHRRELRGQRLACIGHERLASRGRSPTKLARPPPRPRRWPPTSPSRRVTVICGSSASFAPSCSRPCPSPWRASARPLAIASVCS
jgi:hypothetical protein